MYDKLIPQPATIRWIRKETRDTSTYAIRLNSTRTVGEYRFRPGQFNMIYLPGVGEAPISISSSPGDRELTHTIRVAGNVTTALSKLSPGDTVGLRGPFGSGWSLEEADGRSLLIIAGGLGIAPLRPVVRLLAKSNHPSKNDQQCPKLSEAPVLLYGAKTPKDVIFRDEFPRYRKFFRVYLTVDKTDPEEYWKGEVGLISSLLGRITLNPLNTVVFMCGPEVMMKCMIRCLLEMGIPEEKIFISMERNMNCGVGTCGHCMFGPTFVCKDGPVFRLTDVARFLAVSEV